MLAHFTGNMRKDIALAGKIDAEHRSRQNLRHGALRDDLFFLRHCAANIPRQLTPLKASAFQGAAISSPPFLGELETVAATVLEKIPSITLNGTVPAKVLASIREAPHVSTTRRSGEARPRL